MKNVLRLKGSEELAHVLENTDLDYEYTGDILRVNCLDSTPGAVYEALRAKVPCEALGEELSADQKRSLETMLRERSVSKVLDWVARIAYQEGWETADMVWDASKQAEGIEINAKVAAQK